MAQIDLQDVTFTYPGTDVPVIDALSVTIDSGEAHALLGASGAGKTTLLNLLSGLLHPTQGRILFDGEDVSALPGRARKVAQVFQFPVLYESLNVRRNVEFPLTQLGMAGDEMASRVDYIVDELEIGALLGAKPPALSLFEKQLVALAKALVRPDISVVLLDEPLTAVEPRIKWRLRQALRRVKQDLGVTMIYVTHDQTEALTFADRVSVLTADGILQTDTPEEIYNNPCHEFVGHFIGSPGMNFVDTGLELPGDMELAGVDRVGFRPEWVSFEAPQAPLRGVVEHVKAEGARGGEEFGITKVRLDAHTTVQLRGPLTAQPGQALNFSLTKAVLFSAQRQVGVYAASAQ